MALARKYHPKPTVSAIDRACIAWRTVASVTRADARDNGVHGELRQLDEVASGHRGKAAPKGIHMLAREMRAAGIPFDEAAGRLCDVALHIAQMAYAGGPEAA
jgi:hypothetical protein